MKNYRDFEKVQLGGSDIASLTVRTHDEAFPLNFGGDSSYSAYYVTGEAEIGEHYTLVKECDTCWIKVYDDDGLAWKSENWWGREEGYNRLRIYRAGEQGCIIQFTKTEA